MRTSTNFLAVAIFGILCINSVLAAPVTKLRRAKHTNETASADGSSAPGAGTPASNSTTPSSGSGSGAGSGPWYAVYTDKGPDPAPAVDQIKGFNVVIMSFILSSGAADMAMAWQQLPASQRSTIKQQYQAAGIKLLVSAFGSTETPTTSGKDPKQLASTMAAWVKQYGVDGIDVDYEDIDAMNKADGKAEQWLVDFTNALRTELPQGQFILTHAPMAPWMGSGNQWKSGAYVTVNKQVGSKIDWYNTQFYNQGASEYTTCDGLLTKSSSNNPKSSVFEIQANGFELNKIVIGKPGSTGTGDATNGQMSTSTLAGCVSQAKAKGWNAGVMSWEYPDANSAWISAVLGGSSGSGASNPAGSAAPIDGDSSPSGATSPTGSALPTVPATSPTGATSPTTPAGASSSAPLSTAGAPGSVPVPASPAAPGAPAPTQSFNNGMWTPAASTPTGQPAPKKRGGKKPKVASRNRMVRRRKTSKASRKAARK